MNNQQTLQWGFISQDGYFQPISSLSVASLEYVDKSLTDLHTLLQDYIYQEKYEQCALIRDEISKRSTLKIIEAEKLRFDA